VRGYEDLSIELYLSASTLRPFLNYSYSKRAVNYDNIEETLRNHFGNDCNIQYFNLILLGLITGRKEFLKILEEEKTKFKPFGRKVGQFTR
jgi:hypothetical protein